MSDTVLIGRGDAIHHIPQADWERHLRSSSERVSQHLAFMTNEHHLVRNFVVQELPRQGRPLSLSAISLALGISRARTSAIAEDLERNLFFLVRAGGDVSWAFPVTAEDTGHHLLFSTGERIDAA